MNLKLVFLNSVLQTLPNIIWALIVLVVGWVVCDLIGKIVGRILKNLKVDSWSERVGLRETLEKAEIRVNLADLIGYLVKWILFILVISIVAEILALEQFTVLLQKVLGWLPNLVVAVLILVVGFLLADILDKLIRASAKGVGLKFSEILGILVRWGIYVFVVLIALFQLGIGRELIKIIFFGVVTTLSLAFGLAFGLGGKDVAKEILEELKKRVKE
jgi:small-conductance mechanosensitive channel